MNGSAVRLGIIGMGPANMASTMFGTEIFVVVSLFLLSKFLVPKTLLQEDPDLCYPLTDHQKRLDRASTETRRAVLIMTISYKGLMNPRQPSSSVNF